MPSVHDQIHDNALATLLDATAVHVCSAEPTTYVEATDTLSLGSKATPTFSDAEDRPGGGRQRRMAAISDGSSAADGKVKYYAIVDGVNSRVLITDGISREFNVTNWDITGSVGTITFEDAQVVTDMMTLVNGRDPDFGYIVLGSAIGNIPAGRYVITGCTPASRTLTIGVIGTAGSGAVTATASVLPYDFQTYIGNTWSLPEIALGFPDPI